ncbi:MAG: zf-HC2 domain-containing protein [Vicinamibacteria bacterium]
MTLLHFRYRQRLSLLASGSLDPREAEWVRGHVAECASCHSEFAELSTVASMLRGDADLERPLPISSEALRTRVFARLRTAEREAAPRVEWSLAPALSALGLVGLGMVAGVLATRGPAPGATLQASLAPLQSTAETALNDAAFYDRLEKTHTRAKAVRYLAEAQDVLIQVSAAADCPDSPKDSVDVTREAQTSRSLLRRRAALVSGSGGALLAAQGVMEEVEGVLQRVAELPKCTRRQEVDAIARSVDRRNLLMKIDLVAQELAGP